MHKLRVVRQLSSAIDDERRKGRSPERARDVDTLLVSARVVVVESGAACSGDVSGPEV